MSGKIFLSCMMSSTLLFSYEIISFNKNSINENNLIRLKQECNNNNANACIRAGEIYEDIKRDKALAVNLYKKACKLNHARGCNYTGVKYEYGVGVKENRTKAIFYY